MPRAISARSGACLTPPSRNALATRFTLMNTLQAIGPGTVLKSGHPVRNVTMHINIDIQHAWPLRQALVRDCEGQSWTLSVTVLPGGKRMRCSLTLPGPAIGDALARIGNVAPEAEVDQLFEVPEAPSEAWNELAHGTPPRRARTDRAMHPASIGRILHAPNVLLGVEADDRLALFGEIGAVAARQYGLDAATVTSSLLEREASGSTGLGQGIAVPHGRIAGVAKALAFYVRPAMPIPFDAPDGRPVSDLVCLLLPDWASNIHLHLLASVAERFCDHRFRARLRQCTDPHAVSRLFAHYASVESAR